MLQKWGAIRNRGVLSHSDKSHKQSRWGPPTKWRSNNVGGSRDKPIIVLMKFPAHLARAKVHRVGVDNVSCMVLSRPARRFA